MQQLLIDNIYTQLLILCVKNNVKELKMNRRRFLINNSKFFLGVSLISTTGFSMYDNARFKKFITKRPLKTKEHS